jgi:acyl-CoA thioesterase YciA
MTIKPATTAPAIKLVMMPKDTNGQGSIFGGVILSLIDQAAVVEALRQSRRRYVTVAMDAVEFHEPVHVGDIVTLWAETKKIGRTSIKVHVMVLAERRDSGEEVRVTSADVTMVAIDESGTPVAVLGS